MSYITFENRFLLSLTVCPCVLDYATRLATCSRLIGLGVLDNSSLLRPLTTNLGLDYLLPDGLSRTRRGHPSADTRVLRRAKRPSYGTGKMIPIRAL
jgi:hypothetical protein